MLSEAKLLKEQTRAKNKETLLEIINSTGLTDAQKQKLAQLFDKISKLDLDVDKLKQQAESIYNKLQDLGLTVDEAQGWLDKIVSFFKKIAETVSSWF